MYQTYFPQFDSTIYEIQPDRNTGVDQILELTKIAINSKDPEGSFWDGTFNSRILMKFDLTSLSSSIVSGEIPTNAKYYLRMFHASVSDLPVSYNVYAYPVSESWSNGNGNYGDVPEITEGVSWLYRTGTPDMVTWSSASNVAHSFQSTAGGGNWYTGSGVEASQSFEYDNPDIRMNVTDIVNSWLDNSIPNEGFMIKRHETDETGSAILGSLKFFSKDTHTVFLPRLEAVWDDSDLSGTGSYAEIGETDFTVHLKNVKARYTQDSRAKIRMGVRETYPIRTFSTSSNYIQAKRLPTSSYYSVLDVVNGETIIPFDELGTRLSCDSNGNYFRIRMNALMPERIYEVVFKVERDGGDTVDIINDGYKFKVVR